MESVKTKFDGVNYILVKPSGKILLQLRDNIPTIRYPGQWSFPGGHTEDGESIIETVAREIKEETGLDFLQSELESIFGFVESPNNTSQYFLKFVPEDVKIVSTEGQLIWKTFEEIESIKLVENQNTVLPKLFKIIRERSEHLSDI